MVIYKKSGFIWSCLRDVDDQMVRKNYKLKNPAYVLRQAPTGFLCLLKLWEGIILFIFHKNLDYSFLH